jgi:hypothetical protein
MKTVKTLIRSVLLYGSESWTLNRDNEERLKISERNILRKIYGPVNEGGIWRIRYNNKLHKVYNEPDVVGAIKAVRDRWLVNQFRMDDSSPCKKVNFNYPYGTRKIERRPTRWLDDVERDLKTANVSNWDMET